MTSCVRLACPREQEEVLGVVRPRAGRSGSAGRASSRCSRAPAVVSWPRAPAWVRARGGSTATTTIRARRGSATSSRSDRVGGADGPHRRWRSRAESPRAEQRVHRRRGRPEVVAGRGEHRQHRERIAGQGAPTAVGGREHEAMDAAGRATRASPARPPRRTSSRARRPCRSRAVEQPDRDRPELADGERTERGARAAGARGVEGDGAAGPELRRKGSHSRAGAEPVHEQQRPALGAGDRIPDGHEPTCTERAGRRFSFGHTCPARHRAQGTRRCPSGAAPASPRALGDPAGPVVPPRVLVLRGPASQRCGSLGRLVVGPEPHLRARRVDDAGDVARRREHEADRALEQLGRAVRHGHGTMWSSTAATM